MSENEQGSDQLENLLWLADSPLYIDSERIERFYDAVVMPLLSAESPAELDEYDIVRREIPTRSSIRVRRETYDKIQGELGAEAGFTTGELLERLVGLPKAKIGVSGKLAGRRDETEEEEKFVEFDYATTPSRQLVQLALHYLFTHNDRIHFLDDFESFHWEDDDTIRKAPRELVFIDFPGIGEANKKNGDILLTRFVPTAAEFEDGFSLLYNQLGDNLPRYKEVSEIDTDGLTNQEIKDTLREEHRDYWKKFTNKYSPTTAMRVVENAADEKGRIQWIDYRVQLTDEGHTLHLHITPDGEYASGVFAYNFIKRAYKHGIRVVGLLKTEPDLDVLAIYNK